MAKLYQYAVIRGSTPRKPVSEILVEVSSMLAESEAEVRMVAARRIPGGDAVDLEGVEILVKGF